MNVAMLPIDFTHCQRVAGPSLQQDFYIQYLLRRREVLF